MSLCPSCQGQHRRRDCLGLALLATDEEGTTRFVGMSPPMWGHPTSSAEMSFLWVGVEKLINDEALRATVENIGAFDKRLPSAEAIVAAMEELSPEAEEPVIKHQNVGPTTVMADGDQS